MDKIKEQKIVNIIYATILFIIFLLVWPFSINDLYQDITKDIGETDIVEGTIIEKKINAPNNIRRSKNRRHTTSTITVQYTVNGKDYTIKNINDHYWEKDPLVSSIGDKRKVVYNVQDPSKAYLKLLAGHYISFVLWLLGGAICILIYIGYIILVVGK